MFVGVRQCGEVDNRRLYRFYTEYATRDQIAQFSGHDKTARTFRTFLCDFHFGKKEGCPRGNECTFAHDVDSVRPRLVSLSWRSELCMRFHTRGLCPHTGKCRFVHDSTLQQVTKLVFTREGMVNYLLGGSAAGGFLIPEFGPMQTGARDIDFLVNLIKTAPLPHGACGPGEAITQECP